MAGGGGGFDPPSCTVDFGRAGLATWGGGGGAAEYRLLEAGCCCCCWVDWGPGAAWAPPEVVFENTG